MHRKEGNRHTVGEVTEDPFVMGRDDEELALLIGANVPKLRKVA